MNINNLREKSEALTPETGQSWKDLSKKQRLNLLSELTSEIYSNQFKFIEARDDGHVYLSLINDIPINDRSAYLLDLELYLKKNLDQGITIWVIPAADKSSLRKLRGIEVKL